MRTQFSTETVPLERRLEAWRDYFAKQVCGGDQPASSDAAFQARAKGHAFGEFVLLDVQTEASSFRRTLADIAADRRDSVLALRVRRPMRCGVSAPGGSVEVECAAGDFAIVSSLWPFDAQSAEAFDVLVIPTLALSPHLAGGKLTGAVHCPAKSPLGALLGSAFDAAYAQAPLLTDKLAEGVLRNIVGLVALTTQASPRPEDDSDPLRASQFDAVKSYIEAHLAEPELDPATAAAAAGISVRQLHRLFEPTGTTFTRYVLRQRLLRCREAIASATGSNRSVIDIAFGWGFNSMATFYRAFSAEFGGPPAAMRASAREAGQTTPGAGA